MDLRLQHACGHLFQDLGLRPGPHIALKRQVSVAHGAEVIVERLACSPPADETDVVSQQSEESVLPLPILAAGGLAELCLDLRLHHACCHLVGYLTCKKTGVPHLWSKGSSLMRKRTNLGPYSSPVPLGTYRDPRGGAVFL